MKANSSALFRLTAILLILAGGALVFAPGVSGPFVFDDATNLTNNVYVQITELTWSSVRRAAFSLQAGPLQRPIAMASFALNYYFADGFNDPAPYKLTNIAIHLANGLLVFWLLTLIFRRLHESGRFRVAANANSASTTPLIALTVGLIWLVHPIQLTSVLYVVQRMTSLAALFTLIGLVCYMKGRVRLMSGDRRGLVLLTLGPAISGAIGAYAKETAILLPVYIATLEYALFPDQPPWNQWRTIRPAYRTVILAALGVLLVVATIKTVEYALPGYATRTYTMGERLLTEPRVLFFYIALLLVPRIDQFAMHHDDIPVSISWLEPWTTLPAVLGILLLIGIAIRWRARQPLLALGILWFFAGHLLESTVIALDIAHEHRNYLASLGVWFVVAHVIGWLHERFTMNWRIWLTLPVLALSYGSVTALRSAQWSDIHELAYFEAQHHPDSASTQNLYGVSLGRRLQFREAMAMFRRAAELDKHEANYLLNLQAAAVNAGIELPQSDEDELVRRIVARPYSASTGGSLLTISSCIEEECRSLQPFIIRLMTHLTQNPPPRSDPVFYNYLLGLALRGQGRYHEALVALKKALDDPEYLHPQIALVNTYIDLGDVDGAKTALDRLRKNSSASSHPRDGEIAMLEKLLQGLENRKRPPGAAARR